MRIVQTSLTMLAGERVETEPSRSLWMVVTTLRTGALLKGELRERVVTYWDPVEAYVAGRQASCLGSVESVEIFSTGPWTLHAKCGLNRVWSNHSPIMREIGREQHPLN